MADTFADLPDALVRDLLSCAVPLAEEIRIGIDNLKGSRDTYRKTALDRKLIKRKVDLDVPREPSVVGIDGSYQIHRLTSLDLCAAAAVAIEGTSKEAKRHWPEPYHRMWAKGVPHKENTTLLIRGLMVSMELNLAKEAPHDLVLLDGSFASLIIYLNQGLSNIEDKPSAVGSEMKRLWKEGDIFPCLLALLQSDRTVAVPKFTSRNELIAIGGLPPADGIDGRTLATLLLEPGEYTSPLSVYGGLPGGEPERYHLSPNFCSAEEQNLMNVALQSVQVIYYRPFGWVPALRLEVPGSIANSPTRLSIALEGITRQFFSPAVGEPYPLFLADRMVKSLGSGVAVIEQTVAQHVADQCVDVELTMLCLKNYRTEGGRGGV
ncbi:MAG: DNA double-strand break repair nuclease NurA [Nitrospira sp.]|nr:DNA double-strand break repair nuclease NurA [Nitrospira sp.]